MGSEPTQGDNWDGCMVFLYHDRTPPPYAPDRHPVLSQAFEAPMECQSDGCGSIAVVSPGFTMFVSFLLPRNHMSVRTRPLFFSSFANLALPCPQDQVASTTPSPLEPAWSLLRDQFTSPNGIPAGSRVESYSLYEHLVHPHQGEIRGRTPKLQPSPTH